MPKSKRNKVVTLSKTARKGRERKEEIARSVRAAFDSYESLFVFEFENMRNLKFKELRDELKNSTRFFLGSNKVLQIAIGKDEATEVRDGVHQVAELLEGHRGLVFTNLPRDDFVRRMDEFEEHDFARTGSIATETVELNEGPLPQFTHDMEPFLRKQGMPVRLNKGVVELMTDFTVCTEGEQVSPEAAKILRLLEVRMAAFRIHLVARWCGGKVEVLKEPSFFHSLKLKTGGQSGFIDEDEE